MTTTDQQKDNFNFKQGGISGFLNRLFTKPGAIGKVIFILVVLTWVPILIFSILSGEFNNPGPDISFSEDFYIHVRFLVALPFMILLEKVINPSYEKFMVETKERVHKDQMPRFNKSISRISKLLASHIPDIAFLLGFFYFTYIGWDELPIFDSDRSYFTQSDGTLAMAGYYYLLISTPIFSLIFFRWLWRWAVWVYSMFAFSRLTLELDSLNADKMAGMYYLNTITFVFSYVIVVPSLLLAAMVGIDIVYNSAVITQFVFQIVAYVVVLPILAYLPLLFFIPQMIKARAFGLNKFGALLRQHNFEYKMKWLVGDKPKDEPILGSADHSSLADISGSFDFVFGTKPVPLNIKLVAGTILITLLPYIPLVFTYYSAAEVFNSLISTMFGS